MKAEHHSVAITKKKPAQGPSWRHPKTHTWITDACIAYWQPRLRFFSVLDWGEVADKGHSLDSSPRGPRLYNHERFTGNPTIVWRDRLTKKWEGQKEGEKEGEGGI